MYMVELRKPILVNEALERIMQVVELLGTETVSLEEAYGRILAEPIIAKHDVPPFDRSAYDGFAVRAVDTIGASSENPIHFHVIGEIGAGHVANQPIGEFQAYRIMTGAILPAEADAVIMLEQTVETAKGFTISESVQPGAHLSFQGEDAQKGETLMEAGTKIHPGTTALLATFGYAKVKVSKRPIVGILSTGTELLDVGDELTPGKIRNSNGPMVEAQLNRMGMMYQSYGMLEDNLESCQQMVEKALAETDLLITTGGVSVGDYDYLPVIYERLGATVLFNKIAMRPGSVTTVSVLNGKLLFGLSGNPSACFTGFELYVRPAIEKMMGSLAPYLPQIEAELDEAIPDANPFTRFMRGLWTFGADGVTARPAGFNKTNAVSSIARGNCIIVLPPGEHGYERGAKVKLLLLGSEQGVSTWNI